MHGEELTQSFSTVPVLMLENIACKKITIYRSSTVCQAICRFPCQEHPFSFRMEQSPNYSFDTPCTAVLCIRVQCQHTADTAIRCASLECSPCPIAPSSLWCGHILLSEPVPLDSSCMLEFFPQSFFYRLIQSCSDNPHDSSLKVGVEVSPVSTQYSVRRHYSLEWLMLS